MTEVKNSTDSGSETVSTYDIPNLHPQLTLSRSIANFIQRTPPGAAIPSISALFIVIILSIVIPILFSPCKTSQ